MTVTVATGGDCVEAWKHAVTLIRSNGNQLYNLLVTIDDPTVFRQNWLTRYNPRRMSNRADNISDVINTVFPYKLARSCPSRIELYRRHEKAYQRGRKFRRNRGAWGNYFRRLTRFEGVREENQLENVIQKLLTWKRRSKTALVFHLSSSDDGLRTRGGPCWHFGELLWHRNNVVDLVAVYRNHDYYNKALGNYIALSKLLLFICAEAGKTPGQLVVHSVHADFGGASMANVAALTK